MIPCEAVKGAKVDHRFNGLSGIIVTDYVRHSEITDDFYVQVSTTASTRKMYWTGANCRVTSYPEDA